jgi:NAD(P)H-hydrate epimerase
MAVLSSQQIRAWDEYTMLHEPITSIDLMERAAGRCCQWLQKNNYIPNRFAIFCGKGNNGGDGLALGRMLSLLECKVVVYILEFGHKGTNDFQINLANLHKSDADIKFIQSKEQLPSIELDEIIIDALLGSGLNRPIEGFTAEVVAHINQSGNEIISIDVPSGLFVDKSSKGNLIVTAKHTLSFQCQKPAFLVAENAPFFGGVHILDIDLDPEFLNTITPTYQWVDMQLIRLIYQPRNAFSHKGKFGHALLIAGSYGKMGAAVLCARACLRGGAGLVSVQVPRCGLEILQSSVPEAMCETDPHDEFNQSTKADLQKFSVVGAGPGLGTAEQTAAMLEQVFSVYHHPMVLDADALNLIVVNIYSIRFQRAPF